MRLSITLIILTLTGCGISRDAPQSVTTNTMEPLQSCTVTRTTSGATIDCPDGTSATVTNGVNVTSVSMVPLCPGFTPSYPNSFPEFGICLDSILYGIYSDHGGFLAELPPGTYSSNGINASCNLVVGPNCQVTQE